MIKVKNKTYQPIPLVIDGKTVLIPKRTSKEVSQITQQMLSLKTKGLLQIIRK